MVTSAQIAMAAMACLTGRCRDGMNGSSELLQIEPKETGVCIPTGIHFIKSIYFNKVY
jgi:hypothetical protein